MKEFETSVGALAMPLTGTRTVCNHGKRYMGGGREQKCKMERETAATCSLEPKT